MRKHRPPRGNSLLADELQWYVPPPTILYTRPTTTNLQSQHRPKSTTCRIVCGAKVCVSWSWSNYRAQSRYFLSFGFDADVADPQYNLWAPPDSKCRLRGWVARHKGPGGHVTPTWAPSYGCYLSLGPIDPYLILSMPRLSAPS